eukprot:6673809-Prymnesium_polylepis.1
MEEAAADDYDGMPAPPAPVLGDMSDRELRKSAHLCFKGEFGMSWRCHQPSPSANPHENATKSACLSLKTTRNKWSTASPPT